VALERSEPVPQERVGQDPDAIDLDEHGRMADEPNYRRVAHQAARISQA
jgi:hypothetical protein